MESLLANLVIEEVCAAGTMYNEASSGGSRTNRKNWAVILKYEGESEYLCHGKRIRSDGEHMVILPGGCDYTWRCTRSGHFAYVEFQCQSRAANILPVAVSNSGEVLMLMRRLEQHLMQRAPLHRLKAFQDTYALLLKVTEGERRYTPDLKARRLAPAEAYILAHYDQPLSNDALAALTGLSTAYFRKLFREVHGTTPLSFARTLRIKKAAELLRGDYGSITDVAMTLGYPSIFDFSRDFKKHMGVSPSRYLADSVKP